MSSEKTIDGATTSNGSLQGGNAGSVPYQITPNATGFTAAGTSGEVLISSGTGAPVWSASVPAPLLGGAAGEVPYQTASSTTSFTNAGPGVLITDGTTPSFSKQISLNSTFGPTLNTTVTDSSNDAVDIIYTPGSTSTKAALSLTLNNNATTALVATQGTGTINTILQLTSGTLKQKIDQIGSYAATRVTGCDYVISSDHALSLTAINNLTLSSQAITNLTCTAFNVTCTPNQLNLTSSGLKVSSLAGGVVLADLFGNLTASPGTAGNVLVSNGTGAPSWGTVAASSSISGGTAGQIPYQTAPSTTAFVGGTGSSGVLMSSGTSVSFTPTPTLTSLSVTGGTQF